MKKWKMTAGVALLVQSITFVLLFVMLYRKKKNLAQTFLAIGAIGGAAGAYMVMKEMKNELDAREQAAIDAMGGEMDDEMFNDCEFCYGDCDECSGKNEVDVDADDELQQTASDDDDDFPPEQISFDEVDVEG